MLRPEGSCNIRISPSPFHFIVSSHLQFPSPAAPMASSFVCLSTNIKHPLFSTKLHMNLPPTAFKVAMLDRQAYRASADADITNYTLKFLPASQLPAITEPMRHMVSAAPSTLAPALCIAACELAGGRRDEAMPAASALQIMHAGAYARGCLPALAGPKQDHPTAFSAGVTLLTGIGMLSLPYEVVARSECDPERAMRVLVEIAEAMGSRGMVEWQLLEAERRVEEVSAERKEGRLLACGAACGAIMGGGSDEAVERLRRCGMYAGMMHGLLDSESGRNSVEEFRSLAGLELQGFEMEKADAIRMLLDL